MTDTVIRLLREFPAIWASIGAASALIIGYIFARKLSPAFSSAATDLAKVYKLQIDAHKEALEMQRRHYQEELDHERNRYNVIAAERDDYRQKLHGEKDAHQATTLQLAELNARPNVDQVYRGQQTFFSKMTGFMEEQTKTMQAIHKSIIEHDKGIEERTALVIERVLQEVKQ